MLDSFNLYKEKINCYLPHFRIGIQEKEKKVLITTRKVKSRWVTHNSDKIVELYVIKNKDVHSEAKNDNYLSINKTYGVIWDNQYFDNPKAISVNEMFKILGISNISELFTNKTPNGYDTIIYTRDPLLKLLSGYVHMLSRYSKENKLLIHIPETDAIELMNTHVEKITNFIELDWDEHISFYNVILENILLDKPTKPNIIDIDKSNDNPKLEGDSYKNLYVKWYDSQSSYVKRFIELSSLYLILELESYYNLIKYAPKT